MPWWRFFIWNAAGGIVWAVGVSVLAYAAGKAVAETIRSTGSTASSRSSPSESSRSCCCGSGATGSSRAPDDGAGIAHRTVNEMRPMGEAHLQTRTLVPARSRRGGPCGPGDDARHPARRGGRSGPGADRGDQDGRPAARHRQARARPRAPAQAGAARAGRARRDPFASGARRRDAERRRDAVRGRPLRAPSPRALGRRGLSARPGRRGDPGGGAHPRGRRRLRRHDLRPALPPGADARGGDQRARNAVPARSSTRSSPRRSSRSRARASTRLRASSAYGESPRR